MHDVLIIGGGVAGMSAALWCDDLGLRALVLEKEAEIGGQLHIIFNPIRNHLGVQANNGKEMFDIFFEQIKSRPIQILKGANVSQIDFESRVINLYDGSTFRASALIIATGVRRKKLGVQGEEQFQGRGILQSGKRDAKKVKGKRVCIIGGGDAALENAIILSEFCEEIFLVHRRDRFRARAEFVRTVTQNPRIKIFTNTVVTKINGASWIENVDLMNLKTHTTISIKIDALLIRIGVEPNTDFCRGILALDEQGYIKINENCETNVKNVFAIGDVASPLAPTISTAIGMGATATKIISFRLSNNS
jgi:thioredoxin reductase (NADPH)